MFLSRDQTQGDKVQRKVEAEEKKKEEKKKKTKKKRDAVIVNEQFIAIFVAALLRVRSTVNCACTTLSSRKFVLKRGIQIVSR